MILELSIGWKNVFGFGYKVVRTKRRDEIFEMRWREGCPKKQAFFLHLFDFLRQTKWCRDSEGGFGGVIPTWKNLENLKGGKS